MIVTALVRKIRFTPTYVKGAKDSPKKLDETGHLMSDRQVSLNEGDSEINTKINQAVFRILKPSKMGHSY